MKVKISDKLDNILDLVQEIKGSSDNIGAITIFMGVVRGESGGEKVKALNFESHQELAPKMLKDLCEEIVKKHGVIDVIVEHRVNEVKVGEDIIYVIVASRHRREGFKALTELIDRIKNEIPIWKKEITDKGGKWVSPDKGHRPRY